LTVFNVGLNVVDFSVLAKYLSWTLSGTATSHRRSRQCTCEL